MNSKIIRCTICNYTYEKNQSCICPVCKYPVLSVCSDAGKIEKSIRTFRKLSGIHPSGLVIGQKYKMGFYRGEEIAWRVLALEEEKALLISDKGLIPLPFNAYQENVNWKDCSLRNWLNNTFLATAFGPVHRTKILETKVTDSTDSEYTATSEENTEDKIFLLSVEEVRKYFKNEQERMLMPSEYAKKQGAFFSETNQCGWWWLRTASRNPYGVITIGNTGLIHDEGIHMTSNKICVRPAMWLNLAPKKPSGRWKKDCKIIMGTYYGEPIKWYILEVDEEKALLLCEKGLDPIEYHNYFEGVTWEKCSLREWLNDTFIKKAFGPLDQKRILTTKVPSVDKKGHDRRFEMHTNDKVFLLSLEETKKYIQGIERYAYPSEYARQRNTYVDKGTSCCWWWLRSTEEKDNHSAKSIYVDEDGVLHTQYNYVTADNVCIRPAMWIKLQ